MAGAVGGCTLVLSLASYFRFSSNINGDSIGQVVAP